MKYLRSALSGLVFGLAALCSLATAQVFVGSMQQSQDLRSFFQIDTVGNFYIQGNRHLLFQLNGSALPTVAGAGCVVTANSTDTNGQLTGCSGANGVVTFSQAFLTAPRCTVSTSNATNTFMLNSSTTTALTITPGAAAAGTWNWICGSVS